VLLIDDQGISNLSRWYSVRRAAVQKRGPARLSECGIDGWGEESEVVEMMQRRRMEVSSCRRPNEKGTG